MKPSLFLRHLAHLIRDIFAFARTNKAWWIVPIALLLLLVAAIVVSVSTISPFIYTLF
jgi:hypothetical protein